MALDPGSLAYYCIKHLVQRYNEEVVMEFDSTQPIWLQLIAEFSRRIAVGIWPAGERIAGVRDLALELGVNPNTVQRAFGELERDNLVRSERTTGRFVTEDQQLIKSLRRRLATQAADDFVQRGRGFGMSLRDAQSLLEERWTDDHDHYETNTRQGG
ncbi:GntR family transcriptional regulator [Tessaracoccus sp. OS52]|uniref:GntR family transcriptional regulator n=1 Tax=Tessaracoccus sp. OS52 TaxID=2886691 RepID=UPI001D122584|nr:GntR family transcriptional regulator [Tessaracoccus sp. OS52]MCC2592672.1 GntR family transcriptional regulator [Tessaracoccus sp. OS52]